MLKLLVALSLLLLTTTAWAERESEIDPDGYKADVDLKAKTFRTLLGQ